MSAHSTSRQTLFALATLGVLLGGCGLVDDEPPPVCPRLVIVEDANRMVRYGPRGEDLTDETLRLEIDSASLECDGDESELEVALRVQFLAELGPAAETRSDRFSYFVAVVTRSRRILAREEFPVEVSFPGNRTQVVFYEELEPIIPMTEGDSGANYVIFVGLALDKEELQHNREERGHGG